MTMCLDEGTLRAYIDGELAEPQVCAAAIHLEACEACRGRVAQMAVTVRRLDTLLDALAPQDVATLHAASPRRRWVVGALAAALAAGIILFFAFDRPAQAPPAVAKKAAGAPSTTPVVTPQLAAQSTKRRPARVRHPAPGPAPDDFVPLAGADPMQMGMVVRVVLPVSDAAFNGGVREIAADVVIGEDGVARAIRFVE